MLLQRRPEEEPGTPHLQDGHDHAEQADGAAEDLHDEDLHEEAGVLGVCQSGAAAHDAHADPAEEVGEAHSQPGSKHGVTWQDGNGSVGTETRLAAQWVTPRDGENCVV